MAKHETITDFYTNPNLVSEHLEQAHGIGTHEAHIIGALKTKSYNKGTLEGRRDKGDETFGSRIHTDTWILEKDVRGLPMYSIDILNLNGNWQRMHQL